MRAAPTAHQGRCSPTRTHLTWRARQPPNFQRLKPRELDRAAALTSSSRCFRLRPIHAAVLSGMNATDSLPAARAAAGVHTARLSDGETAYRVHGERGPWIVLVHGLLSPMFAWEGLAETLATQGYRVLRYDQYGRGLSDRPKTRYDLALYLRQLDELTRDLGIDAMHLVGWSMGGIVVHQFTRRFPERVRSLVFIAPALFQEKPSILKAVLRMPGGRKLLAARAPRLIDNLAKEHLSRPERAPDYAERAKEQLAHPGMGESLASTLANFEWNAGAGMPATNEPPVLLVWGTQDSTTPYRNAELVRRLYPHAEVVPIEGAKHAPHLDHADIVHPAILRFLDHVTGRARGDAKATHEKTG